MRDVITKTLIKPGDLSMLDNWPFIYFVYVLLRVSMCFVCVWSDWPQMAQIREFSDQISVYFGTMSHFGANLTALFRVAVTMSSSFLTDLA